MWRPNFGIALLCTMLVVLVTYTVALAWPDQPPVKAYISGPGIEGQLQITDTDVLETLRLGTLEDLSWGLVKKPRITGEGFKIIRYFDDGNFRFADLTYYANPNGTRSYVYWEDGPMLEGDHTPYHRQWLYTNPHGDVTLMAFLAKQGVRVDWPIDPSESTSVALDPIPDGITIGDTVRLGVTLNVPAARVGLWIARSGEEQKTLIALSPEGTPGHYVGTFVFPKAGEWNWAVNIDDERLNVPMPSLQVVDAVTKPNAPGVQPNASSNQTSLAATESNNAAPDSLTNKAPDSDPLLGILTVVAALIGLIGVAGALWFRDRQTRV